MRKKFMKLVNNIIVDEIGIRNLYDQAIINNSENSKIELPEDVIYRWMVNTVRHDYTNYEQGLKQIHKLNYDEFCYRMYKNAVLDKISSTYPNLSEECDKQKNPVEMVTKIKRSNKDAGNRKRKNHR